MRASPWIDILRPAALAAAALIGGFLSAHWAGGEQLDLEAGQRIEQRLAQQLSERAGPLPPPIRIETTAQEHEPRDRRVAGLRTAALSAIEKGRNEQRNLDAGRAPRPTPRLTIDSLTPGSGEGARDTLRGGRPCPFCPEMLAVPAGTFSMGSPATEPRVSQYDGREEPQHPVALGRPFAVARHPVTRGEFAVFARETGYAPDGGCLVWSGTDWSQEANRNWMSPGFAQDDSHPVVCIDWHDARRYAAWLSERTGQAYRLPSEAEREYITRAGTTTVFWWGDRIARGQANYESDVWFTSAWRPDSPYRKKTVPVERFAPNPWGLLQVHGNVWEWCEDAWNSSYEGAPADGSAWKDGTQSLRVVRGGSWFLSWEYLRSAARAMQPATHRDSSIGFRLVRTMRP